MDFPFVLPYNKRNYSPQGKNVISNYEPFPQLDRSGRDMALQIRR